jgi:hypothetical protein
VLSTLSWLHLITSAEKSNSGRSIRSLSVFWRLLSPWKKYGKHDSHNSVTVCTFMPSASHCSYSIVELTLGSMACYTLYPLH